MSGNRYPNLIPANLFTKKGSLVVATAAETPGELLSGSVGQVPVVQSDGSLAYENQSGGSVSFLTSTLTPLVGGFTTATARAFTGSTVGLSEGSDITDNGNGTFTINTVGNYRVTISSRQVSGDANPHAHFIEVNGVAQQTYDYVTAPALFTNQFQGGGATSSFIQSFEAMDLLSIFVIVSFSIGNPTMNGYVFLEKI